MDGYELRDDGANCTGTIYSTSTPPHVYQLHFMPVSDIDECYDRTDNCTDEQRCENIEGSFTCSCYPPETVLGTRCVEGTDQTS